MLFRSCATFARAACARSRRGFLRGLECGLSLIRFEDGPHSMCTYLLSIACIYNVILQLRPSHSLLIERVLESTLRSLRPSPSSLPPHPLFCSAFWHTERRVRRVPSRSFIFKNRKSKKRKGNEYKGNDKKEILEFN